MMSQARVIVSVLLKAIICLSVPAFFPNSMAQEMPAAERPLWVAKDAEHAFGLPQTTPKKDGTLTLTSESLTFSTRRARTAIPRGRITAVSAGNERIELWGTTGRIIRMALPNGAGLLAATMTHHRVGMMTIEFMDGKGGMHFAVFYLSPAEAEAALGVFGKETFAPRQPREPSCGSNPVDAGSVLVELPETSKADLPDAYRALLYEHVVERLEKVAGVSRVYRYGEVRSGSACPQYTIKLSIEAFKKGNQVIRASTGPVGMFAGATQMVLSVSYLNSTGSLVNTERLKASVRSESESTKVADATAKKLAKRYAALMKGNGKAGEGKS